MAQDQNGGVTQSDVDGRTEEFAREASRPLVAFDFDGTLTIRDSFTTFLAWRAGPWRYRLGLVRLVPAALAYLVHRERGRIKAAAAKVFLGGASREAVAADARRFAEERAASLFRPDALEVWRKWRSEGARLVIVTASPSLTVAPFADMLAADALIGTELAYDAEGRVTGAFTGANCRGAEKVARLKARFGEDLALTAAYGDTSGDTEMLALAEIKGFKVFTARP